MANGTIKRSVVFLLQMINLPGSHFVGPPSIMVQGLFISETERILLSDLKISSCPDCYPRQFSCLDSWSSQNSTTFSGGSEVCIFNKTHYICKAGFERLHHKLR